MNMIEEKAKKDDVVLVVNKGLMTRNTSKGLEDYITNNVPVTPTRLLLLLYCMI